RGLLRGGPARRRRRRDRGLPLARPGARMKTFVLFACVHNAGRSQMAAAFFNALVDTTRVAGVSAGTEPGERVHPEGVAAMQEVGLDLSQARPQLLTPEMGEQAAFLVTMGCGEACPYVPGAKRVDWPLEDPKGKPLELMREIRDEIRARVGQLIAEKFHG